MSITRIGGNNHRQAASTTNAVTYTGTAGNALIVIAPTAANLTSAAISDTLGNTWQTVFSYNGTQAIFYCQSLNSSSANTITITFGASGLSYAVVEEYSGLGAFDKAATSKTALSTAASTNSVTPSQSGELAMAIVSTNSAGVVTFSGWTNSYVQVDASASATPNWAIATQVLAGTSSTSTAVTLNNSITWEANLLLFAPPASYSFIQDSAACSSTAVSSLATPAITVTAGHFLIAAAWTNGQTISSVSDGVSDPYSLIGNAGNLYVYCCPNAVGGSTAVTFNFSGATNVQVYLAEYSGLGKSVGSVLASSNATSNTGATFNGGPVNASSVPAMLWAMCVDASNQATAPLAASPLTARTSALWTCNNPFSQNAVGDVQVNTAGNVSSAFTLGSQFDTARIMTVAIATSAAIPQTPPLAQLFNRRQQLFFGP